MRLISALAYHELTTQIPHAVDVALPRGAERPRIDYPPVSFHWFSGPAFTSGIEMPTVDGQRLRIYSAEKSIADAFKYRSKLGLDIRGQHSARAGVTQALSRFAYQEQRT